MISILKRIERRNGAIMSKTDEQRSRVEDSNNEKVIGILGGMGPEATLELFRRILDKTSASTDQDHLRIIIDNNPKIPDRTATLLHGGEDPIPLLLSTATNLENAGADFIIMPCNTAHHYIDRISAGVNIPLLNMVELTVTSIREPCVGILATDGTLASRLYHKTCSEKGILLLCPDGSDQKGTMGVIYLVKGRQIDLKNAKIRVSKVAKRLIDRGAQAIILGCTEISLVLSQGDVDVPIYDPLEILAEEAIKKALSS